MKRFSMAMMGLALAGLMTTVSCRKPVVGFTNGEARTVTISAVTESGGGSKTAIDGQNVNWSEGDQISMNGSEMTLKEGAGTTEGVFEGTVTGEAPYYVGYPKEYISYDADPLSFSINIPASWAYDADMKEIVPMVAYAEKVGDDVQFRNAVNMLKLQLKGGGADDNANKLKRIVLTSTESNLSGKIEVTFDEGGNPTFNAIAGDGASKTMTVSFGDGLQLTEEATCVYIPLAKIAAGEVLTVRFDCAVGEMEEKVTATSAFDAVNNMLDCGVVEVKAVPKFSVSATTKVEFAKGNLWYGKAAGESTPAFHFEANQWSTTPASDGTWNASHVSHFFWSNTKDWQTTNKEPYAASYSYSTRTTDDVFFTEASGFQVSGETAGTWRTLTDAEWKYLLGGGGSYRDNASKLRAWVTLSDVSVSGLVILPDGSSATASGITTSSALGSSGAVFLPAAGYRDGTVVYVVGSGGLYWSSTPVEGYEDYAYTVCFLSGAVGAGYVFRYFGYAVRLVR